MVNHINENEYGHILTVEDPIEFVHQPKKCLINQREVHRDTLGFNEALRSALREDPDVILVGEMRDLETIRSEEHTSELQSLMRISYAVFCLKKKITNHLIQYNINNTVLIVF